MIVVVDLGMGNIGSIANMLKKVGAPCRISSSVDDIAEASKLILPGVGAFDNAMSQIERLGLAQVLHQKALEEKTPILGVCLGMQLLTKCSEEGKLPGLGWIDAQTVKFQLAPERSDLKIPHMGWNGVKLKQDHPLFHDQYDEPRFYFVHSYHVRCNDEADILTTSSHGIEFTSSVARGNIFGAQYHPEKSHKFGIRLYANFVARC